MTPEETTPERDARDVTVDSIGPLDEADPADAREWIEAEIEATMDGIIDLARQDTQDPHHSTVDAVLCSARYAAELRRIMDEIDARVDPAHRLNHE